MANLWGSLFYWLSVIFWINIFDGILQYRALSNTPRDDTTIELPLRLCCSDVPLVAFSSYYQLVDTFVYLTSPVVYILSQFASPSTLVYFSAHIPCYLIPRVQLFIAFILCCHCDFGAVCLFGILIGSKVRPIIALLWVGSGPTTVLWLIHLWRPCCYYRQIWKLNSSNHQRFCLSWEGCTYFV